MSHGELQEFCEEVRSSFRQSHRLQIHDRDPRALAHASQHQDRDVCAGHKPVDRYQPSDGPKCDMPESIVEHELSYQFHHL